MSILLAPFAWAGEDVLVVPGLSGQDCGRLVYGERAELKTLNPSVNVVLSSGFAEQNKIGAMLAQGLRGFIPKPYTREKLLEQVRSALDASRRPIG